MKKAHLLLSLILGSLFIGCSKDNDNVEPPVEATEVYNFGCTINDLGDLYFAVGTVTLIYIDANGDTQQEVLTADDIPYCLEIVGLESGDNYAVELIFNRFETMPVLTEDSYSCAQDISKRITFYVDGVQQGVESSSDSYFLGSYSKAVAEAYWEMHEEVSLYLTAETL